MQTVRMTAVFAFVLFSHCTVCKMKAAAEARIVAARLQLSYCEREKIMIPVAAGLLNALHMAMLLPCLFNNYSSGHA